MIKATSRERRRRDDDESGDVGVSNDSDNDGGNAEAA